jgi:hypothetical protein
VTWSHYAVLITDTTSSTTSRPDVEVEAISTTTDSAALMLAYLFEGQLIDPDEQRRSCQTSHRARTCPLRRSRRGLVEEHRTFKTQVALSRLDTRTLHLPPQASA